METALQIAVVIFCTLLLAAMIAAVTAAAMFIFALDENMTDYMRRASLSDYCMLFIPYTIVSFLSIVCKLFVVMIVIFIAMSVARSIKDFIK